MTIFSVVFHSPIISANDLSSLKSENSSGLKGMQPSGVIDTKALWFMLNTMLPPLTFLNSTSEYQVL